MQAQRTLIFLDVESSGLEPATNSILEIGLIAVSLPDFTELGAWSTVIRPAGWYEHKLAERMPERVRQMHAASGLLRAIASDAAVDLETAEAQALAFVLAARDGDAEHGTELAGYNPSFDLGFLRAHMPRLARQFSYRCLDCNALWLLRGYFEGKDTRAPKKNAEHRVLADCRAAIRTVHEHFEWTHEMFRRMQ